MSAGGADRADDTDAVDGTDGTALEELLELLAPEQLDADTFRGGSPADRTRGVYGGQVAGQALAAAGRTVPAERPVHSLHSYFVRPGDPTVPFAYAVERLSDGRSRSARRVTATQRGKVVFTLAASFHRAEAGLVHQDPMPQVPDPERLPTYEERLAKAFRQPVGPLRQPFDLRFVGPLSFEAALDPALRCERNLVWLRAAGPLPADPRPEEGPPSPHSAQRGPLLHAALLTYISDISLLDTVALLHGLAWGDGLISGTSLDHAMWFHRPFRADEWLLYAQRSPVAHGARGLVRGEVFGRDGRLVASVAQEGLIRVADPAPEEAN